MPGFGDLFGPKIIESDESIVARGGIPPPAHIRAAAARGETKGGIQYDRFVPPAYRIKFRRMKAANFVLADAEALRDATFDKLAEVEWMNRAKIYADNDYYETKARLDAMKRNVK